MAGQHPTTPASASSPPSIFHTILFFSFSANLYHAATSTAGTASRFRLGDVPCDANQRSFHRPAEDVSRLVSFFLLCSLIIDFGFLVTGCGPDLSKASHLVPDPKSPSRADDVLRTSEAVNRQHARARLYVFLHQNLPVSSSASLSASSSSSASLQPSSTSPTYEFTAALRNFVQYHLPQVGLSSPLFVSFFFLTF